LLGIKIVFWGDFVDGRSVCILLVDDEEMVLDVGRMMLERMGYQVIAARGSAEAVGIYAECGVGIDLVLLDYRLPDGNGGEAFRKIREINPEAKVVLSTGSSEDEEILDLMKRGCRGMIQKPFGIAKLTEKIGAALS
jgi:DNA-binding NtrC family response regulator